MSKLLIEVMEYAIGLPLPEYATQFSAGMDLVAAEDASIQPGQRALIGTGLKMIIPQGFEGQIRPRSGLALKNGITLVNTPGTIDSDYRGEVKIIMINLGEEIFVVSRGMRIAQLVIAPVAQIEIEKVSSVDKMAKTTRGSGGFGSTGVL